MSCAERFYSALLRAYPSDFRTEFGSEMMQAFRGLRREKNSVDVRFWASMIWDALRSAPALQLQSLRARSGAHFNFSEGIMKTMAILAFLIGALAGALVAASAVALLRRTPRATAFAQGAAITCLAVFLCFAVLHPMFSGLATLLGIGFPIAMLVFLFSTRGRSTPIAA